jgi:ATP-binding cassette, subfamily B, multidrug efflux pump
LMDTAPQVTAPEAPVRPARIHGRVAFEDVSFAYDGTHRVVQDVSFTVEPGRSMALVGSTGAGKTTLMNLLARFYDVTSGRVTIDGIDVRDLDPAQLRSSMAVVLQDVHLFSGTIASNIRLGSDIPIERVRAAAEAVHAHRFIETLPQGYDTVVRERGATLSVGQKQLLSFARALAHDPRILVLDEATSSVDTETEGLIQDALRVLLRGRTAIVIAHRLSTIQNVDEILVMHKGRVRERGTHAGLLAQRGLYWRLYQLQYKEQEAGGTTEAAVYLAAETQRHRGFVSS